MKTRFNRRNFLKISALAGGGLVIGLPAMTSCNTPAEKAAAPTSWKNVNAFLKIADNGEVTIKSPNPEIGQGVKTSMPMIVAEELDIPWEKVRVEQAPLDTGNFRRQVAGGSQSIRQGWHGLRMAGASAKFALLTAAATQWELPLEELQTKEGKVLHPKSGKEAHYGELAASAAQVELPEEIEVKDPKDFSLIGTDVPNVDNPKIVSGQPLFGLDYKVEGMLYAMVLHPPAFGAKLKSVDDSKAKAMPGIQQVIRYDEKVAVIGNSTWEVKKAKDALVAEWQEPSNPESTAEHEAEMRRKLNQNGEVRRKDGNPEEAFARAATLVEASYEAPFLPHNTLEPMNFFAHVSEDKAVLVGPTQTPARARKTASDITGLAEDKITVDMTRTGGGFGRRLYTDFVYDAVKISKEIKAPVKVIYTREDDMTAGTYRPTSQYKFRAALNENNELIAYHQRGVSFNGGHVTRDLNIPAGAVDNLLMDSHKLSSEITTGAWRSPTHNFLGFAEQSFLDEVAHAAGKDPLDFRMELFEKALESPVGKVKYDAARFAKVLQLAAQKADYGKAPQGTFQGVSCYYSHSTYVAQVAEVVMDGDKPKIKRIVNAVDCGIVVNPTGAINQVQGSVIDGIGHTFFGALSFEKSRPRQDNFDDYRLIRLKDVPQVEVHFVESKEDPTGLGEPALNPAPAAVGNALFAATGKRWRITPIGAGKQPGVVEMKGRIG